MSHAPTILSQLVPRRRAGGRRYPFVETLASIRGTRLHTVVSGDAVTTGAFHGVFLASVSTTGTLVCARSMGARIVAGVGQGLRISTIEPHSETMEDATPRPEKPQPPALMSTLEGAGSLLVIGGILACSGTVANPSLASTLLPLGVGACVIGVLVVWVARLLARTR